MLCVCVCTHVYISGIAFLVSEKLWILKHIWPQYLRWQIELRWLHDNIWYGNRFSNYFQIIKLYASAMLKCNTTLIKKKKATTSSLGISLHFKKQKHASGIDKWKLTPHTLGKVWMDLLTFQKWHFYETKLIMFMASILTCNELRMLSFVGLIY